MQPVPLIWNFLLMASSLFSIGNNIMQGSVKKTRAVINTRNSMLRMHSRNIMVNDQQKTEWLHSYNNRITSNSIRKQITIGNSFLVMPKIGRKNT